MKKLFFSLFVSLCAMTFGVDWTSSMNLSEPFSRVPQVVVDPCGNAIAIWGINPINPSEGKIQASYLPYGSSQWSPPVNVSSNLSATESLSAAPQIAIDGCGNAIAVWGLMDSITNIAVLQSATLPFGNTKWSNPVVVTPNLTPGQQVVVPVIAMNRCGNIVATWGLLVAPDVYTVQAATRCFGSDWSTPVFLVDLLPGQTAADSTQVAIDGQGNSIAIWGFTDPSTNTTGVQSSTLRCGSDRWSTPIYATSGLTSGQTIAQPGIVVDNIGNAVSVWGLQVSPNVYIVQAARLPFGSLSWSAPTNLTPDYLAGFTAGASPQLAVDGCGNVAAIWGLNRQNTMTSVETAILPFGSSVWSSPINLTPDEMLNQFSFGPQIAADSNGNLVALWPLVDVGANTIVMQTAVRPYSSTVWGKPQPVSVIMSNSNQEVLSPDVAIGGRGKAVAIWDNVDTEIIQSSNTQLSVPTFAPFSGCVVKNQFLSQIEYAHLLTWHKSDHPCIGSYRIYLGDQVVATVGRCANQVSIRNRKKGALCNYRLVPVTAIGVETDSVSVTWF